VVIKQCPSKPYQLSFRAVRRVWAAVSMTPQATLRELMPVTGLAQGTIGMALRHLQSLGYIDFDPRVARARTVLVPFIEVYHDRN
jgi:DNA-binding MarR family transcriptional regulator